MIFSELHKFLSENVLNQYNLYRCYEAVFDMNHSLWSLGLEEYMFPETDHLTDFFRMETRLGEKTFGEFTKSLSEPHYDQIEMAWFRHCEQVKKYGEEISK